MPLGGTALHSRPVHANVRTLAPHPVRADPRSSRQTAARAARPRPTGKRQDIMRRHFIALAALAALSLSPASAQQLAAMDWQIFVEPQFGTQIDYPAGIFSQSGGQSERGVGERFRSPDGQAILEVYSYPNAPGFTPASFLRANLQMPRSELGYERVTGSFFAISSVRDGTVYYSRCNFSRSPRPLISCFDLTYPEAQARAWDAVVTRMSLSLRPSERG
jgi:hypothetical protein